MGAVTTIRFVIIRETDETEILGGRIRRIWCLARCGHRGKIVCVADKVNWKKG